MPSKSTRPARPPDRVFHRDLTRRRAPTPAESAAFHDTGRRHQRLCSDIRTKTLTAAFASVGLTFPADPYPIATGPADSPTYQLNHPLQHAMSEFVRKTGISLPQFVELLRGQTSDDYRPNKAIIPGQLTANCSEFKNIPQLLNIANNGIQVRLTKPLPHQAHPPQNHPSARRRLNVLRKNIRKEQDLGRCIVLDLDILKLWIEIFLSPFGVVDKGEGDPSTSGRVIHDLSHPDGESVNSTTDTTSIPNTEYEPCERIAREILHQAEKFPSADIKLLLGDVASAFQNLGIHSSFARLFAGTIPEDNSLVIDFSACFGWTGSPAFYGVAGRAIVFLHGRTRNECYPDGFFNYHWVDDHVCVAAGIGSNCQDTELSLRHAMMTVLGVDAINDEKFTCWSTRQKALGLVFDTTNSTVSMPASKILKAQQWVSTAFHAKALARSEFRSLMGCLRHVATCVRAARPFLQRLRAQEGRLHRCHLIKITDDMKQDLVWWYRILKLPVMNGVPLSYFRASPPPHVVVEMDASDVGICALDRARKCALTYAFADAELTLIREFRSGVNNNFDINYRELLSCAMAVYTWAASWRNFATASNPTVRVHFRIDNTSAVSWQNKMSPTNPRAQLVIRLLGYWEAVYGFRFSSSHIAGVGNVIADAGSRLPDRHYANRFANLTRDWMQVTPDISSLDLTKIWLDICASIRWQTLPSTNTRRPISNGDNGPPNAASALGWTTSNLLFSYSTSRILFYMVFSMALGQVVQFRAQR